MLTPLPAMLAPMSAGPERARTCAVAVAGGAMRAVLIWMRRLGWLAAFIAPDGLNDTAASINALIQSYLAAQPVYALLGVPDRLGIHFRPGPHRLAPEDWTAVLDFADQQLRGMGVKHRFDQLPPQQL